MRVRDHRGFGVLIGTLVSFSCSPSGQNPTLFTETFLVSLYNLCCREGKKIVIAFFLGWVIFAGTNLLLSGTCIWILFQKRFLPLAGF